MTNRTLYAGADPGLDGAIAFFDPAADRLTMLRMPTFEITVGKKKRRRVDVHSLARALRLHADDIALATIEEVHAMPKQGVSSGFSFGASFGLLWGVVAALDIPAKPVEPAVWKRRMGLTGDKDASRRLASRLLPRHAHLWPLKKDDGAAEAALLAIYGATTR